jgi:small subunit ribosomal protein S20
MAKTDKKDDKKKVKRPSRLKRLIQSKNNQQRNRSFAAKTKTAMKKLESAASTQAEDVAALLSEVYSLLDKAVKKGMLKINKASRDKAKATRIAQKSS